MRRILSGVMTGTVVIAHNATSEADDGVALAALVARLDHDRVVVARVLEDAFEHPGASRAEQQEVAQRVEEIRAYVARRLPGGERVDIVPVLDPSVGRGLHDIAEREAARMLVLGSSHHGQLGRVLLGGTAELVVNGAPCAVAVAPPGFRDRGALEPPVIGVAYDGSAPADAALALGARLAAGASVPLRLLGVQAPWWGRPIGHGLPDPSTTLAAGRKRAIALGLPAEQVSGDLLSGDPGACLAGQTPELGLLLLGTRGRGGLRRALLGSVSTHVVRHARCPVAVCPAP